MEINASTKHSLKKKAPVLTGKSIPKDSASSSSRRGSAPKLQPETLAGHLATALHEKDQESRRQLVKDLFRKAIGESPSVLNLSAPHTASTTRSRGGAAADLAVVAREIGVPFVWKECGIYEAVQTTLIPKGIQTLLLQNGDKPNTLKPSASALSLSSMDNNYAVDDQDTYATSGSGGTDTKRGKTTPPNAREGCLLILRAFCEIVGKKSEPYIVGAFLLAALDECASSSSAIREAAEDASTAIVQLAHPWSFITVLSPLLLQSLESTEWRVKYAALERLEQCTRTAPAQVHKLIPELIPPINSQVWDTKAQVSKAARSALLAICSTNANQDVRPTIPAIVNAMCKPADTNKAVSELMGTTFVVPVDASTLAILCPVLARALKEKLAIHKRAACLVISNMSKLVESPSAVAPFGSLLVPELQKVAHNVQFEEIRDEALKALANLTKALGDLYKENDEKSNAMEVEEERGRVEAEQQRIREEREEEDRKAEELRKKEEEERKRFKEAMDAQRELEKLQLDEEKKRKDEEELIREKQKLSTKGSSGKCQGCGLKKCPKSCMFYKGD